jgi:hypothetical protein
MTTLLTNRCPLGCSIELAGSAGSLAVRCGVQVIFTGWAHMQSPGGMIQEVLGSMGGGGRITGPMDESAGGRTMSDTPPSSSWTRSRCISTQAIWPLSKGRGRI